VLAITPHVKRLTIALLISACAAVPVHAQTCKAVSADEKPLQGAAKTSHMKKCCEDNAKNADGKTRRVGLEPVSSTKWPFG
jgi:hypothetical protein